MIKRYLSMVLIICLVCTILPSQALWATEKGSQVSLSEGTTSSTGANRFKDVSQEAWYYDAVCYVVENNIFQGTAVDIFDPNGHMTRGMYVTVLGRIAKVDPSQYAQVSFKDVTPEAYYAPYVEWATQQGITSGVGFQQFAPDSLVTREQMVTFTERFFESIGLSLQYDQALDGVPKDRYEISSWAEESVLKLWQAGIVNGDEKGYFNPKAWATRAEAARFCNQVHQKVQNWTESNGKPVVTNTPTGSQGSNDEDSQTTYTITFESNGGTPCDAIAVVKGQSLEQWPTPLKADHIFVGWYRDPGFAADSKIGAEDAILTHLTVYARYLAVENNEADVSSNKALADQEPSLGFEVIASDTTLTSEQVKQGLTLEAVDGTENVELVVQGRSGHFSVYALDGFTPGASYKLTLHNESLHFEDDSENIRTYTFTIQKEEVYEISLNNSIIYIPSSDTSHPTKNGVALEALAVPVMVMSDDEADQTTVQGTFQYHGSEMLENGDILCIYSGDKPESGNVIALDDTVAYVKVIDVRGNTITYIETEAEDVIFLPDIIPINTGEGNALLVYQPVTTESDGWLQMYTDDLDFTQELFMDMGLDEMTTIDVGDYLSFYTPDILRGALENEVDYGRVTAVSTIIDTQENKELITVLFASATNEDIEKALDYYSKQTVESEQLLSEIDKDTLEEEIAEQVIESGFSEQAAAYLTTLVLETETFNELIGESLEDEDLVAGIKEDMRQMTAPAARGSTSKKVEITNPKVTVSIGNGNQFGKGSVRCNVAVAFEVKINSGDSDQIVIQLSASFVEEIKVGVNAQGKAIWKKKWIFPYISDYHMNANVDVYNYTGISFKAIISTKGDKDSIDISKEIARILKNTHSEEITAGVQGLFELYCEMLENETDFIELFSQSIVKNDMSLLLGIIQIRIQVDFVVGVDINVALGCNFDYTEGTRYTFWAYLKAREAGSETINLVDETYRFEFYVMGQLGLRAGIRLEFAVGLFSVDLNSVGLTAEAGVYTRLYGYFYYYLESVNKVKNTKTSGALYFELGAYLEIAFKAQVLNGKYMYNPTLYEKEWPLWNAGIKENIYDFAYDRTMSEVRLKDKVRQYKLPSSSFNMIYLDLKEGEIQAKNYQPQYYTISVSNPNFKVQGQTITWTVPQGTHQMSCDVTVMWNKSPLAFSSLPIQRTFRITWDDLNDAGYTLTFDTNGGNIISSMTQPYGTVLNMPSTPTRLGYTFQGWYTDALYTKPFTDTTMGYGNTTVYAKWLPNANVTYQIRHYTQDVSNEHYTLRESETHFGATDTAVVAQPRSYLGFTYQPNAEATVSSGSIQADGSLILELYYTRNTYTVTFNGNNGEGPITRRIQYEAMLIPPTMKKVGYRQLGWQESVPDKMPAYDLTLTATWEIETYLVTFYTNGGGAIATIRQAYDTVVQLPPDPTKEGYTFKGWYREATLKTPYKNERLQGHTTLYAKWERNETYNYIVAHYYGDEVVVEELQSKDKVLIPRIKPMEGFSSPVPTVVTLKADETVSVHYEYKPLTYTLTMEANGGIGTMVYHLMYGEEIRYPEVTRQGYELTGWYLDAEATLPSELVSMPSRDLTLYCGWNLIQGSEEVSYSLEEGVWLKGSLSTALMACETTTGAMIRLERNIVATDTYTIHTELSIEGNGYTIQVDQIGVDESDKLNDEASNYALFRIEPEGIVHLSNMHLMGGQMGVIINEGRLTMDTVEISRSVNKFNGGGGLTNDGYAYLKNSHLTHCIATYGGGFFNGNDAYLFLDQTSVTHNQATESGSGGGGGENKGTLYINNSTIANNTCREIGGGINNYNGSLYMMNSTLTGNTTTEGSEYGGGIGYNGGNMKLINTIILHNYAADDSSSNIGYYYGADVDTELVEMIACLVEDGLNPFAVYEEIGEVIRPALERLDNGTYGIFLSDQAGALSEGVDTYLSIEDGWVEIFNYDNGDFILDEMSKYLVKCYQDGTFRESGVIGAMGSR